MLSRDFLQTLGMVLVMRHIWRTNLNTQEELLKRVTALNNDSSGDTGKYLDQLGDTEVRPTIRKQEKYVTNTIDNYVGICCEE